MNGPALDPLFILKCTAIRISDTFVMCSRSLYDSTVNFHRSSRLSGQCCARNLVCQLWAAVEEHLVIHHNTLTFWPFRPLFSNMSTTEVEMSVVKCIFICVQYIELQSRLHQVQEIPGAKENFLIRLGRMLIGLEQ
jgi:hypothetical protein